MAVPHRKIGLDYLRAAAILFVLTAHAFHGKPDAIDSLGFLGVEIFFVLSGYLIGGILLTSMSRAGNTINVEMVRAFWVRRWMRTVPNYLLFLPVYMALDHFFVSGQIARFATFTQNLVTEPHATFYTVSWSLTVEEWFYLLLPVMTLGVYRLTHRIKPALLITVMTLFIVPLTLRLIFASGHSWNETMRKIVVYRLDALMWGVALAAMQKYRSAWFAQMAHPAVFATGILGMIAVCAWVTLGGCIHADATATDAFIFDAAGFSAALVLPWCSNLRWSDSILSRFAHLTSLWSYSLYLCHLAVFRVFWMAGRHVHIKGIGLIAVIAAYAVAAAVYYGFERPILRLRDQIPNRQAAPRGEFAVAL